MQLELLLVLVVVVALVLVVICLGLVAGLSSTASLDARKTDRLTCIMVRKDELQVLLVPGLPVLVLANLMVRFLEVGA